MKYVFFFFSLITTTVAWSQARKLDEVVGKALLQNLQIQLAKNELAISNNNNYLGATGALPTVSLNASDIQNSISINQQLNNGNTIKRDAAPANNLNVGLQASVIVYNGKRVYAQRERLEELEKLSEEQLRFQIQEVVANTSSRYYDIVRLQYFLRALRQTILFSEQQVQIIESRKEVGLANQADLLQAQIDLNQRKQELQTQELLLQQTKVDLLNLLQEDPTNAFVPADTLFEHKNTYSIQQLIGGISNNPQLATANKLVQVNEWLVKEATSQKYPILRFNTGYNYNRNQSAAGLFLLNQNFGPFAGLALQVPIYNGSQAKRQEKSAQLAATSSKIQEQNTRQLLEASIVKVYQAYQNAVQQITTEQQNFEMTKSLNELVLQRFSLGQATILEVRAAQQSFENAAFRLINLNHAAKLADIEMKRLTGQL